MRVATALVLMTGCPFIFEAPDYHAVDRTGGDDDGPTTIPTTETGTTPTGGPPVIAATIVRLSADEVAVEMAVPDPDFDLPGGVVLLDLGGSETTFAIPDDLTVWDPVSQEATISWSPPGDPCDGYTFSGVVTVTDGAGHPSDPAEIEGEVVGLGTLPEQPGIVDLGTIAGPTVACGVVDDRQDKDEAGMVFAEAHLARFELTWTDPDADPEFRVYAGPPAYANQILYAYEPMALQVVGEVDVEAGPPYSLRVSTYRNRAITWRLFLE